MDASANGLNPLKVAVSIFIRPNSWYLSGTSATVNLFLKPCQEQFRPFELSEPQIRGPSRSACVVIPSYFEQLLNNFSEQLPPRAHQRRIFPHPTFKS